MKQCNKRNILLPKCLNSMTLYVFLVYPHSNEQAKIWSIKFLTYKKVKNWAIIPSCVGQSIPHLMKKSQVFVSWTTAGSTILLHFQQPHPINLHTWDMTRCNSSTWPLKFMVTWDFGRKPSSFFFVSPKILGPSLLLAMKNLAINAYFQRFFLIILQDINLKCQYEFWNS